MIRHNCPRCKARMKTPDGVEKVRCPKCGHQVTVPPPDPEEIAGAERDAEENREFVEARKRYDREKTAWQARWETPPMTTGGAIFAVIGGLLALLAGAALIHKGPRYSSVLGDYIVNLSVILGAIKWGFFLVAGFLMIVIGTLSRKVARRPTRHEAH